LYWNTFSQWFGPIFIAHVQYSINSAFGVKTGITIEFSDYDFL